MIVDNQSEEQSTELIYAWKTQALKRQAKQICEGMEAFICRRVFSSGVRTYVKTFSEKPQNFLKYLLYGLKSSLYVTRPWHS